MICDRCRSDSLTSICSMFNMEQICFVCKDRERSHPLYAEAVRVESEAVQRGDYNFAGIGLPADLRVEWEKSC